MMNSKKIFVLLLFCYCFLVKSNAQDIIGTWQGRLNVLGKDVRTVFHFVRDSTGALTGTTDSPDQGIRGVKIDDVYFAGDSLYLSVPEYGGEYAGNYNKDSAAFYGNLKQSGFKMGLKLVKGEAEDLLYKRPQKPVRPYPYHEEEVSVPNKKSGIMLAGTLTRPNGNRKFPAAILITGSGAEDRDESVFGHKPFLILADYLTRKGFAVLRCDDRGTARSTGVFETSTPDDLALDVEAQLDYLKTRSDIDLKKIGLIGHSEGGILAPMVAARRSDVAFVVMMAGPGIDMFDLILIQDSLVSVTNGASQTKTREFLDTNKKLFALVKAAPDSASAADSINNYLSSVGRKDKIILETIRQLCNPWMRWYIGFNPAVNLGKLRCPVLAINGEKDVQVPAAVDIAAINEALRKGGNKNFKTEILPGLNHLFQACKKCSIGEYVNIEQTMDPSALSAIGDWMEKNFVGSRK